MFIILCILTALALLYAGNVIYCSNTLTYNEYTVKSKKVKSSVRFVAISDTEGKSFGEHNQRLVEKIDKAKPEFVLILGDMVERSNGDFSEVTELCKKLTKKYPVYYILGNHEQFDFEDYNNYESELISAIEETGANLLVNEMTDYHTNGGDRITLAGLKNYPFYDYDAPLFDNEENRLFQKYLNQQDDSHFSLLLIHQPETYIWKFSEYNIDLMMCGHTHGGVIRLPFVGGLYAPEQKWFPEYDKGYFTNGKASMIISSGLDGAGAIPRFNNPPNVTVVNITPEN